MKSLNLEGQRFGRLTAISMASGRRDGRLLWNCICDCGTSALATSAALRGGHTRSCGCLRRELSAVKRRAMIGRRFSRWTVISEIEADIYSYPDRTTHRQRRFMCQCDCGTRRSVQMGNLVNGTSKSCGCWNRETASSRNTTHGETRNGRTSTEYRIWLGMNGRCNQVGSVSYADYGGRGIKVCDRWSDFSAFLSDMGRRPSPDHSIDRIDVNGNYEPGNCRWATRIQQARNKRKFSAVEKLVRKVSNFNCIERWRLRAALEALEVELGGSNFRINDSLFAGAML